MNRPASRAIKTDRKQNFVGFPIPGSAGQVLSSTSTSYGVNLNLSWEVDLWGRLRAGTQAAIADAQAAEADWAGARLSLAAQTARAYFAAVEAGRQVELAHATVENYRVSTEQIQRRYRRGLRSSLDLRLGRSSLAAAQATLEQRRQQQDISLRQLELLLGRYPSASIAVGSELPAVDGAVPAGLPADLIARRPDLIAAERRLAAADRRLVGARRALLPSISLTASTGRSSSALGDLLNGDFSIWNLVSNISQPFLQGGRLRAGVDQAAGAAEGALFGYAQSALRAYGEVETRLSFEGFLADQEQALATAATEATAARVLAEERSQGAVVAAEEEHRAEQSLGHRPRDEKTARRDRRCRGCSGRCGVRPTLDPRHDHRRWQAPAWHRLTHLRL